jgi:hypothetical protein
VLEDEQTSKPLLLKFLPCLEVKMRNTIRKILVAIIFIWGANVYADVSEATFTPQGRNSYPAVQEADVEIYALKPDFKFRIIGTIEARGMAEGDYSLSGQIDSAIGQILGKRPLQPGEKEDIALAMRALRQEAALNGALGVVILQSVQVRVSANGTERRIVAAAIRPE